MVAYLFVFALGGVVWHLINTHFATVRQREIAIVSSKPRFDPTKPFTAEASKGNPFDQFDSPGTNPFDQFDAPIKADNLLDSPVSGAAVAEAKLASAQKFTEADFEPDVPAKPRFTAADFGFVEDKPAISNVRATKTFTFEEAQQPAPQGDIFDQVASEPPATLRRHANWKWVAAYLFLMALVGSVAWYLKSALLASAKQSRELTAALKTDQKSRQTNPEQKNNPLAKP